MGSCGYHLGLVLNAIGLRREAVESREGLPFEGGTLTLRMDGLSRFEKWIAAVTKASGPLECL